MIDDCMAGKIDMFITKSISRFARNTVDSLMNIRKLKEKNIAMFFGKENINTLGDVRQFENGVVYANHNKFLGYTKVLGGGGVIIEPNEAKLVRRIFWMYLEGSSINKIAEILTNEGVKTVTGNTS